MKEAEKSARAALARYYGDLTDPRYANDPIKAEARLKEAVRKVWKEHGKALPEWTIPYIAKWAKSAAGKDHDDGAVRSPDEGRAVGVAGDAGHG